MRNDMWTKGLVVGIIMLFAGTSVVPNITGIIRHENNESYQQEMKEIKTMHTSVSSLSIENVVTTSDPSFRPDEVSTKKLVAEKHSQSPDDSSVFTIDNTSLSLPLNNDVLRAGDIIEIQGTANGSTFQYYVVEWGIGEYPTEWFSTGMLLVNDGLIGIEMVP